LNKFLSSICIFIILPICALSASVTASYITGEWHWFGRSGAIVTMAGLILSVRPVVRRGFNEWLKQQDEVDYGTLNGNTAKEIEEKRQIRLDLIASYIGMFMTITGTLIWGYGDLL
jgi:hypothetical protein